MTATDKDINNIVNTICDYFDVNSHAVMNDLGRNQNECDAKFCITYLLHRVYHITTDNVSRLMNIVGRTVEKRCNSIDNVYYYNDIYNDLIKTNPHLLEDEDLKNICI